MSTNRLVRVFYAVVLATALGGSVTAAAHWLGVDWWIALAPIAAVELGGVVLMRHADERRQLGERATAAMGLSFAFAGTAVATNVFGHDELGLSAFFGGMSGLGFAVYLLITAADRRDALREAGKLEDIPPTYGLVQWLLHPGITRRARILAQANSAARLAEGPHPTTPRLGRLASLAAAREQVRAERRQKAIATALDKLIRAKAGPTMAEIAVNTYDVEHIARRIADLADLDGYAALISGDLTPAKLAGNEPAIEPPSGDSLTAIVDATTDAILPAAVAAPAVANSTPTRAAKRTPTRAANGRQSSADLVAKALAKKPDMTQADVVKFLGGGVSLRTVQRNWPKPAAAVNGHDHSEG